MNPYILGLLLIVLWRLWGLRQIWSIAKFHGEEWCFDTLVGEGFYMSARAPLFSGHFVLAWSLVSRGRYC